MANKMTKRDYYTTLRSIVENTDREDAPALMAFIDHEVELLNRKSSKPTETKTQKENKTIMETIRDALLTVGKPVTITELQTADARMAQYSNQKISALLRQMPDVEKTIEKKKAYFSIKA